MSFFSFYVIIIMGDSMEKGKDKKKTTTSTNKKKSTSAKKVANISATKKGTVAKKSNDVAKTSKNTVSSTKKIVKEEKTKIIVPEDVKVKEAKDLVIDTKSTKTERGEKAKSKKEKLLIENNEITNLTKIILVVTGIFLAFYLITYLVTKNSATKDTDTETKAATIQYDEILLSNLLKQNNSEYYVLAYDADDVYYDAYNTSLTAYSSTTGALRVYKSIISNGFNKTYYDAKADSNTNVSSIEELKLNASTLFKIKDGKVEQSYVGHDAIVAYLNTL